MSDFMDTEGIYAPSEWQGTHGRLERIKRTIRTTGTLEKLIILGSELGALLGFEAEVTHTKRQQ